MRTLSAITLLSVAQALRPLAPLRKLGNKLRKTPVVQAAPSGASLKPYLSQLIEGEDLAKDDAKGLFGAFLDGTASPEQVAAVLCCLRQKGETPDEIAGAAEAMNEALADAHAQELSRFGASELHAVAAVVGGVASQEAVKVIARQYEPVDHTYVFNGIAGVGGVVAV